MKTEHTPCYILHRRDYRESSLILEIISREFGRVSLIAKGAKRNKKQQGVTFSLYQKYLMAWTSKTELGTLVDVELSTVANQVSPDKMMLGFYMNEIILRLLHKHEPHPELFDSYDETITELFQNSGDHTLLRYFEKRLLQSLGYGVILDQDLSTGDMVDTERDYHYIPEVGPSSNLNNNAAGVIISGQTLHELDNESLSTNKNKNEAKILLRTLLNQYLGNKPLASRELYQSYINQKQMV